MKRRKWTRELKTMIVLSGLRGQSISDICNEHGISQSQYYLWRDQFLSNASKAFDTEKVSQKRWSRHSAFPFSYTRLCDLHPVNKGE